MQTRFVITAIKKDGLRHMAFSNNIGNTHETKDIADKELTDILAANTTQQITELIGTDLRVEPVQCYDHGDSTRTVFDN